MNWDWNAIYLTCFGIGLALSFVAFFGGALHFHVGHWHVGGGGLRLKTQATGVHVPPHGSGSGQGRGHSAQHVSPINGFTVVAFLCWFGGTGYLLHRANIFGAAVVLLFSALSGMAGGSLVFWFLAGVLVPNERTLESADTEIVGVVGKLSAGVSKRGVGEILYSQNGARRSAVVRSEDGSAIERGAEVIVMRYAKGVAFVRRWDEFEHGLLADGPGKSLERESREP